MKRMRRMMLVLLAVVLVLALSACSSYTAADAKALVQGSFDLNFHGTASDSFLKSIGKSRLYMETAYQDTIEKDVDAFIEVYAIEDPTGAYRATLIEDFKQLYPLTKYEIGDATANGKEAYSLTATIYPLDIFVQTDALIEARELDSSEEDFEVAWANRIISCFEDAMKTVGYKDAVEIPVEVQKDPSDGLWFVATGVNEAYNALLPY